MTNICETYANPSKKDESCRDRHRTRHYRRRCRFYISQANHGDRRGISLSLTHMTFPLKLHHQDRRDVCTFIVRVASHGTPLGQERKSTYSIFPVAQRKRAERKIL